MSPIKGNPAYLCQVLIENDGSADGPAVLVCLPLGNEGVEVLGNGLAYQKGTVPED